MHWRRWLAHSISLAEWKVASGCCFMQGCWIGCGRMALCRSRYSLHTPQPLLKEVERIAMLATC